ncbi:MAG: TAXI family TRAP transporter solute-binding subunit [Desulfofustis sp.]|nr:TAXI family TRAP transporter solute-binding subunit [Desulfofustis sp.]NNK58108.1 TAXI family TRAP transporter solute-binding subunit [Desulfofustis sp.]
MIAEIVTRQARPVLSIFSLFAALLLVIMSPNPAASYEMLIGTGPSGSFSFHSGKLLCRIFTKHDQEMTCSLSESTDPIDNLTNVQGGSLDLALVDSLLLEEAAAGRGPFQYLDISYDRIRVVSPLYEVPLTLLVSNDAELSTVDQLPGKRINVGPFGSPQNYLFKLFMQAQGWTEKMFPVVAELPSSMSQDTFAFRQGDVQVLVHRGVHPDNVVTQLMKDTQASLIGFANQGMVDLVTSTPSLSRQEIGKATYPSLTGTLSTFGTTMTLVASADTDDETIRSLVTALEQNTQSLQTMHSSLAAFTVDKKPEWFGSIKAHRAVAE